VQVQLARTVGVIGGGHVHPAESAISSHGAAALARPDIIASMCAAKLSLALMLLELCRDGSEFAECGACFDSDHRP